MAQLHFKKTQLLLELVMEYNNIEFEIKKIQVKSSVHFAFWRGSTCNIDSAAVEIDQKLIKQMLRFRLSVQNLTYPYQEFTEDAYEWYMDNVYQVSKLDTK